MLQSLYNALTGMRAQQYNIDVIGNNIANISTVGYKGARVEFADALYSLMKRPEGATGDLRQGSGVLVSATLRMLDQGGYELTGATMDFMIDGTGYFTLAGAGGQRNYTRDGAFEVSTQGGQRRLVSAEGYPVLGANGQPIVLPGDPSMVSADASGNLYFAGTRFASLLLTAFPNPEGLSSAGGNRYQATAASGAAQAAAGSTVRQGVLEASNVDLSAEMARLIQAQKAFSVMGTAVRTADEMETTANRLSE